MDVNGAKYVQSLIYDELQFAPQSSTLKHSERCKCKDVKNAANET